MINNGVAVALFITLLSCNGTGNTELKTVKFNHFQLWHSNLDSLDLKDSTTFVLETASTNGRDQYILKSSIEDSLTAFEYSIKDDSIFYQNRYCRVLDSIQLDFHGTSILLFISDFDEPDSGDEESYLFWNSKYGLVGVYNWTMGPVLLFEPPDLNGFSIVLYDYIVQRERERRSG